MILSILVLGETSKLHATAIKRVVVRFLEMYSTITNNLLFQLFWT